MGKNEHSPQLEKFKQAARVLEADEDEARWEDRLKRVAKSKPNSKKPNAQ